MKADLLFTFPMAGRIKNYSDRITVMRDGRYINTVNTQEADIDDVIRMMVGREIFAVKQEPFTKENAPVALKVENLNAGRMVQNVSFYVRQGEILGFAGLVGAGRTEVARAIFAGENYESGDVYIYGKKVKIKNPSDAVKAGIAYLSEDRRRFGLVGNECRQKHFNGQYEGIFYLVFY